MYQSMALNRILAIWCRAKSTLLADILYSKKYGNGYVKNNDTSRRSASQKLTVRSGSVGPSRRPLTRYFQHWTNSKQKRCTRLEVRSMIRFVLFYFSERAGKHIFSARAEDAEGPLAHDDGRRGGADGVRQREGVVPLVHGGGQLRLGLARREVLHLDVAVQVEV